MFSLSDLADLLNARYETLAQASTGFVILFANPSMCGNCSFFGGV